MSGELSFSAQFKRVFFTYESQWEKFGKALAPSIFFVMVPIFATQTKLTSQRGIQSNRIGIFSSGSQLSLNPWFKLDENLDIPNRSSVENCKMFNCEEEFTDFHQTNESKSISKYKFWNHFCQVYHQMKIAKVDTIANSIRKPSNQNIKQQKSRTLSVMRFQAMYFH